MARAPSEYFQGLSIEALKEARWRRIMRSANLRKQLKEVREELWDCRSELHEIETLIARNHQPIKFPATVEEARVAEPETEAPKKRRA